MLYYWRHNVVTVFLNVVLQNVPYGDNRRLQTVVNACTDPGILMATAQRALKKVSLAAYGG